MTTTSGDDGYSGAVALLWGQRERPTRGPKPALTIDRIANTAVAVADADGLAAVTMQRVAAELSFTKMSLYRYVAGKAELVAVMIEAAVGAAPDLTAVPGGWRPKLEEWARQMWATWDRHPWLPGATMGDRVMGPREVAWTECAIGAVGGTGLAADERMDTVFLLSGHIRNTRSMATAGTQPWTAERQLDLLSRHRDRFPALAATVSEVPAGAPDHARTFGLARILDGLELLVSARPAGG